ncbi:hypothetical protein ACIQAR_22585 [Micromonospora chalcea]
METVLRFLSGAAWAYAYWRIVTVSRTDRSYGMPLFAAALNMSWELIYFSGGVVYWSRYDVGTQLQTVINGVWLLLDVGIIVCVLRYGNREFQQLSPIRFSLLVAGAFSLALTLQVVILLQFEPEWAARFSAFLQNVYMSAAFVAMAIARKGLRAQRIDIGVARLAGTLAPTISAGLIGQVRVTILVLGLCCVVLDSIYLFVLRTLRTPHDQKVGRVGEGQVTLRVLEDQT